MFELVRNQVNTITFVMIDSNGDEVTGLGSSFTLQLSKAGGAFAASAGTKAEIGSGWYSYQTTAGECDTVGPVAIKVTGAGAVQQNLEYVVINAVEFTYTVTVSGNPLQGATVWISTDVAGSNVIWEGTTNASGVAVDTNDEKPYLLAGDYFFWTQKTGYSFVNPDTESVS
jgi:hypothetical protein